MRRHITLTSLALVFPFAACGDDGGGKVATDATTTTDSATATDGTSTSTNPTDATGGTDVVQTDTAITTTQDTSVSQDTAPDPGASTCPGIILCLGDCTTAACQTGCLAAGSEAEQTAVTALVQCQASCFPKNAQNQPRAPATSEEYQATYECLLDTCVEEAVTCESGDVYGDGNCLALNNCLVECDDVTCTRDCMSEATEEAALDLYKLDFCIQSECYDMESNPPVSQACATQAQQVPPCSTLYTQCLGDVGAAPGAGGAGGAGDASRSDRGWAAGFDAKRAQLLIELLSRQ